MAAALPVSNAYFYRYVNSILDFSGAEILELTDKKVYRYSPQEITLKKIKKNLPNMQSKEQVKDIIRLLLGITTDIKKNTIIRKIYTDYKKEEYKDIEALKTKLTEIIKTIVLISNYAKYRITKFRYNFKSNEQTNCSLEEYHSTNYKSCGCIGFFKSEDGPDQHTLSTWAQGRRAILVMVYDISKIILVDDKNYDTALNHNYDKPDILFNVTYKKSLEMGTGYTKSDMVDADRDIKIETNGPNPVPDEHVLISNTPTIYTLIEILELNDTTYTNLLTLNTLNEESRQNAIKDIELKYLREIYRKVILKLQALTKYRKYKQKYMKLKELLKTNKLLENFKL